MRLISQNKDTDVPYECAVLSCETIDGNECVIARVDGIRYVMGEYENRDLARSALEDLRNKNRINATSTYAFHK